MSINSFMIMHSLWVRDIVAAYLYLKQLCFSMAWVSFQEESCVIQTCVRACSTVSTTYGSKAFTHTRFSSLRLSLFSLQFQAVFSGSWSSLQISGKLATKTIHVFTQSQQEFVIVSMYYFRELVDRCALSFSANNIQRTLPWNKTTSVIHIICLVLPDSLQIHSTINLYK